MSILSPFFTKNKKGLIAVIVLFTWLFPSIAYFLYVCNYKTHLGTKKIILRTVLFTIILFGVFIGAFEVKSNIEDYYFNKMASSNIIKVTQYRNNQEDIFEFNVIDKNLTSFDSNNLFLKELGFISIEKTDQLTPEFCFKLSSDILGDLRDKNTIKLTIHSMNIAFENSKWYYYCGYWMIFPLYFNTFEIPERNTDGSYSVELTNKDVTKDLAKPANDRETSYSNTLRGKIIFKYDPFIKEGEEKF